MNQKCKVCGEPAAGFHFGAFTCEGCKSFFGRTYSNVTAIGECKNGGQCVINKKNRTSCKACRLRKCLYVGMSKSGSRYGRRSNWFKIHCLLQEQTGMDQPLQGMFNGINNPSNSSPEVKEEEEEERQTPSTSSTRSQSPMDDEENHSTTSKENLRLMLSRSPAAESPCSFKHRPAAVLKRTSPQPGLLAIGSPYSSVIHHPMRTSSPKLPSESGSSRHRHHHHHHHQHASSTTTTATTTAALFHLYHQQQQLLQQHRHHSVSPTDLRHHHPADEEQESPIDLSCKSSSSSPTGLHHASSTASMCHIRAEILTGLHPQSLRDAESSGAPLDLTTKG